MKKALSVLLALMMVLTTLAVGSVSASALAETGASGKIYFDTASAGWSGFSYVRFHIWAIDDPDFVGFDWGAKKQQGADEGNGVWSYDLDNVNGIKEGCQYGVIFYNSNGQQTYNLLFGAECIGKKAYCNGVTYENPEDSEKTAVATVWEGIDQTKFGPELKITSIGNIVGTCCPASTTPYKMFVDFLSDDGAHGLQNALKFSGGKTAQQIIDDTAATLGLTLDQIKSAIKEAAKDWSKDWDETKNPNYVAPAVKPAVPKANSVANKIGYVEFKWSKAKNAKKYRVYWKVGSGSWKKLTDTTSLTYKYKKATAGKKNSFAVAAISKDGTMSAKSAAKTIIYVATPTPSKVAKAKNAVKFTWKKAAGAKKYRVMRKVGKGKFTKLADTKSTSYTDKKVKKKTKYTYTVIGIASDGKTLSAYNTAGKSITYK